MTTKMTSTKVQDNGTGITLKDKIMKLIIATLGMSTFSFAANAAEVYNFYFQKPPGQEAAATVNGEQNTPLTQVAPTNSQTTVIATQSAEKKDDFKKFRINAGFGAMNASQTESYAYCYDSQCYTENYDISDDFTGLQLAGKYNVNRYFGLELGYFEGSAERGVRNTTMQMYGISINTIPDSERFQFELSAKNASIANSSTKNKLSFGARFTYNFNPSNGVSIETTMIDYTSKKALSNSYYALSYVFYL